MTVKTDKCPNCGSTKILEIVYYELFKDAKNRKVLLGMLCL